MQSCSSNKTVFYGHKEAATGMCTLTKHSKTSNDPGLDCSSSDKKLFCCNSSSPSDSEKVSGQWKLAMKFWKQTIHQNRITVSCDLFPKNKNFRILQRRQSINVSHNHEKNYATWIEESVSWGRKGGTTLLLNCS